MHIKRDKLPVQNEAIISHAGLHFDQRSSHWVALLQPGAKKYSTITTSSGAMLFEAIARAQITSKCEQICFQNQPFLPLFKHTLCSVLCEYSFLSVHSRVVNPEELFL